MRARMTKVAPVLAAVAALGVGGSAFAYAQTSSAQHAKAASTTTQPAGQEPGGAAGEQPDDRAGDRAPAYQSSITAPEQELGSDATEAKALQSTATTTPAEATATALAAVPGSVGQVELDNENGNVVYSVEITKADGSRVDVKVDAGNAKVLHQEADNADEGGHGEPADAAGATEAADVAG